MNVEDTSQKTLLDLYNDHSGKLSDKWQSYLFFYEEILKPYREKRARILEIGIQNGGFLEILAKYFPKYEKIVGCDIDPKCGMLSFGDDRISVVVGNAANESTAKAIFRISGDFDIIIDDGSHVSSDIVQNFSMYFTRLKPGGVYICEDLHCSYWKDDFNGGLNAPFSSISFFKRLCDVVNFEHWGTGDAAAEALDYFAKTYGITLKDEDLVSIKTIVFANSLCAIFRSNNTPNHLGARVVVGRDASVSSEPKAVNGLTLTVPDQLANPWGPRLGSPEQIVADVFKSRAREKNSDDLVVSQQETIKLLRTQLEFGSVQQHLLQDRVASQEETIESLRIQLELGSVQEHLLQDRVSSQQETIELLRTQLEFGSAQEQSLQDQVASQAKAIESLHMQLEFGSVKEHLLQDRVASQQEVIQLLRTQLELAYTGATITTELIARTKAILHNPVRSFFESMASRSLAKLPVLSEGRRQKFLRSAHKRDARVLLEDYARLRLQLRSYRYQSAIKGSTSIQNDLDGMSLPTHSMEVSIDIVVCIHNALDDVKVCLSSLIANTLPPYRLIIVDDGSRDETKLYLETFAASQGAVLLRNDVATGYTLAANTGLRASIGRWTILLNSDTIIPFGWLEEMLKIGTSDPKIGIVGPASNTASWQSAPSLINEIGDWADNPLPRGVSVEDMQRITSSISPPQGIELPFINGFAFMIRRELIDDIGIFDEHTFGAGYGEENDYCIRARNAGWKLIFAPNAYIYHTQSKSYSTEKRLKLAAEADRRLNAKHDGKKDIISQVYFCKNSLATLAFRSRLSIALEDFSALPHQHSGKRIAILCPVAYAGGGANILVQEAICLNKLGCEVWLINLSSNQAAFEKEYGEMVSCLFFSSEREILAFLQKNEMRFDAVIASAFFTTAWIPDHFVGKAPRLGYYIQDDEPAFFEETDPGFQAALKSYTLLERGVGFTKTSWNANAIERRGFTRPAIVGASVDLSRFRPKGRDVNATGPVRIAAMVRFDDGVYSEIGGRRAPERTIRILNRLSDAYADGVELIVFGGDPNDDRKSIMSPNITDLGRLSPDNVAVLMRTIDIFLDFSVWQAMGLSAMEAMASGCAVVVPSNGGTHDFCVDQHNALIVDTRLEDKCFAAASRLVEDDALLQKLRQTATHEICAHTQRRSAIRILDVLFGASA